MEGAMKIKNRKGDISITLLVIGVFAVFALAIISFFVSQNRISSSFTSPAVFGNISSQLENFYVYVDSGVSREEAAGRIGAKLEGNRMIIAAQQKGISVEYRINFGG